MTRSAPSRPAVAARPRSEKLRAWSSCTSSTQGASRSTAARSTRTRATACVCWRLCSTGSGPTGSQSGASRSSIRRAWSWSTPVRTPTSRSRSGTSTLSAPSVSRSPRRDCQTTRLREAGLDPGAVRHHVFTHLHVDHVGAGPLAGANVAVERRRVASRDGARVAPSRLHAAGHPRSADRRGGPRSLRRRQHPADRHARTHCRAPVRARDAGRGSAGPDRGRCRLQRGRSAQSHHRRGRGFPKALPNEHRQAARALRRHADRCRPDARPCRGAAGRRRTGDLDLSALAVDPDQRAPAPALHEEEARRSPPSMQVTVASIANGPFEARAAGRAVARSNPVAPTCG